MSPVSRGISFHESLLYSLYRLVDAAAIVLAVRLALAQTSGAGLPEWLDGNVDTHCLAVGPKGAALADQRGNVWISTDGIRDWNHAATLEHVTAVAIA